MSSTTRLAPPNSVVFVSDANGGEVPSSMGGAVVAASGSCVAVGCRSEDDGETEFTLGTLAELDRSEQPAYVGILKTPSRRVAVRSILGRCLLDTAVSGELTRLTIWVNDPREPDEVVIAVS